MKVKKINFTREEIQKLKEYCVKKLDFELAAKVRDIERQQFKIPKIKYKYVPEPPEGEWIDMGVWDSIYVRTKILQP